MSDNNHFTVYQKVIATWVCIFFFGLIFGTLFLYGSFWFMIPFFAVIGIGAFFLNHIVCPNCGAHMTYEKSVLGVRVPLVFMRSKCKECNFDFKHNHDAG